MKSPHKQNSSLPDSYKSVSAKKKKLSKQEGKQEQRERFRKMRESRNRGKRKSKWAIKERKTAEEDIQRGRGITNDHKIIGEKHITETHGPAGGRHTGSGDWECDPAIRLLQLI